MQSFFRAGTISSFSATQRRTLRLATIMVETKHEEPVYIVISDEDGHSLTVMVIGGTKEGRQAVKDAWNEFYQDFDEDIDAKKAATKFMKKLQQENL